MKSTISLGKMIYSIVFIGSLMLSALAIHLNPITNTDGILYVKTAETFLTGDFSAASEMYFWPFYSIFIAITHKITGLSFINSAYLLNSLLTGLVCVAFTGLARQISSAKNIHLWAAVVILSTPALNEYRHYIIRDFGYWGLCLTAAWFIAIYLNTEQKIYAYLGSAALCLAIFFRIEAATFFIALPLVAAYSKRDIRRKLSQFITLITAPIIMGFIVFTIIVAGDWNIDIGKIISTVGRYINLRSLAFTETLPLKIDNYATMVIEPFSDQYAAIAVVASLVTIGLATTIDALGPVCLLLLLLNRNKISLWRRPGYLIIKCMLFVSATIILSTLLSNQFLTSRYVFFIVLLLSIIATHVLTQLFNHHANKNKANRFLLLSSIILVLLLADGFISTGSKKQYMHDSIRWTKEHTPQQSTLFTNDNTLGYYTTRKFEYMKKNIPEALIRKGSAPQTDYWMIHTTKDNKKLFRRINKKYSYMKPVKTFDDIDNDRIIIYRNTRPVQ
jgi:hypothetical protein